MHLSNYVSILLWCLFIDENLYFCRYTETVKINYAPKIYHHDERQYQHHDQRQYRDNRKYKQKDIRDLKNIKPTQVKEKQINPLGEHYKTIQLFLVKCLLSFIMASHCFYFFLSLPYTLKILQNNLNQALSSRCRQIIPLTFLN